MFYPKLTPREVRYHDAFIWAVKFFLTCEHCNEFEMHGKIEFLRQELEETAIEAMDCTIFSEDDTPRTDEERAANREASKTLLQLFNSGLFAGEQEKRG